MNTCMRKYMNICMRRGSTCKWSRGGKVSHLVLTSRGMCLIETKILSTRQVRKDTRSPDEDRSKLTKEGAWHMAV